MSVWMRAVLPTPESRDFDDLRERMAAEQRLEVTGSWSDFEVHTADGTSILAGDTWTGDDAAEDLEELRDELPDLKGRKAARTRVAEALTSAAALVGLQIVMSSYDESVDAANAIIAYLEERAEVLTQIDTVGWYAADKLILRET